MRHPFADCMVQAKVVDRPQLDLLRHRARLLGGGIDRHALEMGLLSVDEVISLYAKSIDLPAVRALDLDRLDRVQSAAFPCSLAERWRLIPLQQVGLSWQVLSDECPDAKRREEVRLTLGVELLVRAIPPFLFDLLWAWMKGEPQAQDLTLLAARLYPRFIHQKAAEEEAPLMVREGRDQRVSGLPRLLQACEGGEACLQRVEAFLKDQHPCATVWRVNGPTLKHFSPQSSAVSIGGLDGLEPILKVEQNHEFMPVPTGWKVLFDDHASPVRGVSVRPVVLGHKTVALLVLGTAGLAADGAATASLDQAAIDLKQALAERLG